MKLLKSQKNEIYDSIKAQGLSPNLFKFREGSDSSEILALKDSNYYFQFLEGPKGGHFATFSPGREEYVEHQYSGSWPLQRDFFKNWIDYVKREINAPDRWTELKEEVERLNFGGLGDDERKFTQREYRLLKRQVEGIKKKIVKLDLLEEQINIINEKLDHLLVLARELNKTDWKNLFVGTFMSLFFQLTVDKETGRTIWNYFKGLFTYFLPLKK